MGEGASHPGDAPVIGRGERGLRLLHVTALAGPGSVAGGVWAVVRAQVEAVRQVSAVEDCRVISGWLGRAVPQSAPGQIFVPLRRLPGARGIRGLWSVRTPVVLRRALRQGVDIVHIHLCRDLFTMVALAVLRRRDHRLVVAQCHGMLGPPVTGWTRLYDRLLTRHLLPRVDTFLALTADEERQLAAMGIAPTRITRIHNAVREPGLRWQPRPGRPVICFVSRLHERKRPMTLVEAALELRRRGLRFRYLLIGPDAGEGERLRATIQRWGLTEVEVVGQKDPLDVLQLLATSTVFVLPSVAEPYPMAVIEAAAVGVPMIVSTETGISEILEAEGAALTTPPNALSVAAAIARLVGDERARLDMSAAARRTYLRHWGMSSLAEKLAEVYGMAGRAT